MRISRIAAAVLMLAAGGVVLAGASRGPEPVREAAAAGQPQKLHAYVTTGDAQWDPRYQPLDSVETVSAFFEHLATVQHVSRAYWRGGRSLNHLNHFVFRPENPVRYDHWTRWQQELNVDLDLNRVAEREAHSRGMEIFLMEALFDLGATGTAEYGGQLPHYGEDRIRLEHPEWIPVDRWGDRRQDDPSSSPIRRPGGL